MHILVPQLFHPVRVPLKWYPVNLLHGHLMLLQYPVYCRDADRVYVLQYAVVQKDCVTDLSQCDCIICNHYVADLSFLALIEKSPSATHARLTPNSRHRSKRKTLHYNCQCMSYVFVTEWLTNALQFYLQL